MYLDPHTTNKQNNVNATTPYNISYKDNVEDVNKPRNIKIMNVYVKMG